jgi:hypothetical protein
MVPPIDEGSDIAAAPFGLAPLNGNDEFEVGEFHVSEQAPQGVNGMDDLLRGFISPRLVPASVLPLLYDFDVGFTVTSASAYGDTVVSRLHFSLPSLVC